MKKNLKWMAVCMVLMLLFAGCTKAPEAEPVQQETEQATEQAAEEVAVDEIGTVVLTGSSTLGPVVTQLTMEFSETNQNWNQVDPSFADEKIDIVLNGGGSGAGAKAVIEGSANFGMVSRPVKDSEKEAMADFKEFKLGTDALTLSVNPENKLHELQDSLSTEELQKIFSGEYKTWKQVNSELPDEEIVVVTRDIGGGAHGVFQSKIMGDIEVSENVIQAPSMGALVTKIIENKNAIGYASFGVVNQNLGDLVPMSVDGVEPTQENIVSGDYIISRPLLVIKDGELKPQEQALIDFLLSDRGMEVVSELGFVPEK